VPPPSWTPTFSLPNQQTLHFATRIQALHELKTHPVRNQRSTGGTGSRASGRWYSGAKTQYISKDGVLSRKPLDHRQAEEDSSSKQEEARDGRGARAGVMHSLASLGKFDSYFRERYFRDFPEGRAPSVDDVEAEFWRVVDGAGETTKVEVVDANDVSALRVGSAFPQVSTARGSARVYATSLWNVSNLPKHPASALRYEEAIAGITTPWHHFGMCMSASPWHSEHHSLYSVSYLHHGAAKVCYSVPSSALDQFEAAMREHISKHSKCARRDALYTHSAMLSPSCLAAQGIPVYRLVQEENSFVVTFPSSYHACVNTGFNCAESSNLAPPDWLQYGAQAVVKYKLARHLAPLSHDKIILLLASVSPFTPPLLQLALPPVFKQRVEQEKIMRREAASLYSRSYIIRVGSENDTEDDTCYVCNTDLYWSALVCVCSPCNKTCLHHTACKCGPSKRGLVYRHTLQDLEGMATSLCEIGQEAQSCNSSLALPSPPPFTSYALSAFSAG